MSSSLSPVSFSPATTAESGRKMVASKTTPLSVSRAKSSLCKARLTLNLSQKPHTDRSFMAVSVENLTKPSPTPSPLRFTFGNVLAFFILLLIGVLGFLIRIFSLIKYESVIHEFDPYFNYGVTQVNVAPSMAAPFGNEIPCKLFAQKRSMFSPFSPSNVT